MYSRAPRKFLTPDADHANPNLGPGCYTADEATLIAGKTLGENGYAPFASLAPRVSYFEETVIHGPSPGAYDPPLQPFVVHNTEKASLFGKSRAIRFKDIVSNTPSPNTYSLPSSMKKKKGSLLAGEEGRYKKGMDHGKLVEGITFQTITSSSPVGDGKDGNGIAVAADGEGVVDFLSHESAPMEGLGKLDSVHGGDAATGGETGKLKKATKLMIPKRAPPPSAKKPAIVWRRKYVPPSIPVKNSAFGYQENDTGELVPRSPPKKNTDPGPAYNFVTSFVEKNKHENNGYRFAKEKKGLKFKITEGPGPGVYDVSFAEKLLRAREYGNGPAVMTLAPCPGAYDFKAQVRNPRLPGANVPAFGSSSNHMAATNYTTPDLMKTPAPGAYYPEFATINKPPAFRPQPFGSTTNRFDSTSEDRSRQLPAPGSYELASFETMSLSERRVRLMTPGGSRPKAFGSISARFVQPRAVEWLPRSLAPKVPGPGQYDISNIPPAPPSTSNNTSKRSGNIHTGLASRKNTPASPLKQRKKPIIFVQPTGLGGGGASMDPNRVRVPVFGSQTARFHKFDQDTDGLPPPGAYEIGNAFENLKTKGRIEKQSMLTSQMTRELFPHDVSPQHQKKSLQHQHGAFLSSKMRFDDRAEPVPGPDAYLTHDYDNGLIKKTFNITMREWND
ncbi:Sperm-tail PG-rich repeat-containing protein 2 [Podochytrium sp. JEL0797]|nr:Sperm-tail PG-rich repeat-containing protein 2 [Podochytrium sp. JEL0797]